MRLKTYKEVDVTMKAKNVLFYMAVGREKYKEIVWFNHALSMAIIIHVCCGPLVCFSLFNRIVFYYRSSGVEMTDLTYCISVCKSVFRVNWNTSVVSKVKFFIFQIQHAKTTRFQMGKIPEFYLHFRFILFIS